MSQDGPKIVPGLSLDCPWIFPYHPIMIGFGTILGQFDGVLIVTRLKFDLVSYFENRSYFNNLSFLCVENQQHQLLPIFIRFTSAALLAF